ncbi:M1 family metallopeptidase [Xanthomonas campestris pv. campestris]|uniref:M1 family metallopeptidase n=1 Tax=Xanthomonas campestris TaxID=339 RepID=UPI001F423D71|nr:M1 family metallopeptidase [Xanthomonas campestris]MEA9553969.1 M1 family metallopeptidase [Xanthomonas campestris]MEB1028309.1 M1 family metallopeptidase [Xanthomonas campestris pv. campestris]MEB1101572.1 M1 family metallopeptidase [Xanthomonas campestris pv. campestris]MEB1136489.1 M1 family metallopeptidase [Xanthomonas campestris pv. campestris]MEB1149385.1 M1 family metallopeptidase [Xanthomonas campestris pv. campestris]
MRLPLVTAIALVLTGTALTSGVYAAEFAVPTAATSAASAITTQLPRTARPSHYAIEITPHAETMTFDGKVSIDVEVLAPTDAIVLQAAQLTFGKATLAAAGRKPVAAKVTTDTDAQTASIATGKPLAPGKYVLTLVYSGTINTQANGLFALDYTTAQGARRALFTQFENSDARRFVPSWDEPNFKATFDLVINAPAGQMAVSNMPVASSKPGTNGRTRVAFQTSPKMSTYLLFVSVGDFERATVKADNGTEIGVIAQKGKVGQAQFALESGRDVLHEYNDYFGIQYPLPKLDNIAAPGRSQFFSAMENWGAIFTFEYTLLLDPAVANVSTKQGVFTVAAHEIAHQWFGNLVTMAWWDDLWLNEGFANWMEARTTAKLHPEWDIDKTGPAQKSRAAMRRDAYVTTHPVVQHVATVEQASQAFDSITYAKGEAVIAMLEDYVGEDAWRTGVRSYIRQHQYGNAVTDQLWQQIDTVAPGKQFIQVAHDFTLQPGVPLIKASSRCVGGQTTVTLEQGEFTLDRPDKQPLRWHVPVVLRGGDGKQVRVLVDGTAQVQVPGCKVPVVVNAGQKGYFRTAYAPMQFKALAAGFSALPVVDQLGVLNDTNALAGAGVQPETDLLNLAAQVKVGASPDIWDMVASIYDSVDGSFERDPAARAAWRAYAVPHLSAEFATLGWDNRDDDSAQIQQLRTRLIGSLSGMGDAAVIAEARRRFAGFQANPASLSPELRDSVLGAVALNADAATWDALHALAKQETSSMVRDTYYDFLSMADDQALAKRALELALTEEPGATTGASMIDRVAFRHPELAFDFAVTHRAQVDTLVDSTSRARYYPSLGMDSADLATANKIKAYADTYIAPTSRQTADNAINTIQTRVKLRAASLPQIKAWLAARKR